MRRIVHSGRRRTSAIFPDGLGHDFAVAIGRSGLVNRPSSSCLPGGNTRQTLSRKRTLASAMSSPLSPRARGQGGGRRARTPVERERRWWSPIAAVSIAGLSPPGARCSRGWCSRAQLNVDGARRSRRVLGEPHCVRSD